MGGGSVLSHERRLLHDRNRYDGLCLDVSGASTANGAPVIQWTCSGNANQQWQIGVQVSSSVPEGLIYTFTNENWGMTLAASGGQAERV